MTEPDKTPPAPVFVCPFCGSATPDQPRCAHCSGPLDPLSRQATQNAMGPWFIRDEQHPFRPGCSYETVLSMVARGKIAADTILRGPSTSQFWYPAKRVPGVAHRLASGGVCFSCQQSVTTESECPRCGAVFHADPDRQFMGLMPVRALPGSTLPAPESRPPLDAPLRPQPPIAPATLKPPGVSAPPAFRPASIASERLESEIASLRLRSGILLGVAAGCALVACIAVWVLVSGMAQPGRPTNPGLQSAAVENRAAPDLQSASVVPNAAGQGAPAEAAPAQSPPDSASPPANPPPTESVPPKQPDSEALPSEELASLRAIRWP